MRIIGGIDLLGGRAVHARGGRRDEYAPVEAAADRRIDGDPVALVRTYQDLAVDEIYVADLDAIAGRPPQDAQVTAVARAGLPVWLDAGIHTGVRARAALGLGATHVVVGLETLPSFDALDDICAALGGERVVFSLDLCNGQPIGHAGGALTPDAIAGRAARSGAGTLIVLDLARVGMRHGLDETLIRGVRHAVPDLALFVGGGIRDTADLETARALGCDGALIATALHDGRIHGRATR